MEKLISSIATFVIFSVISFILISAFTYKTFNFLATLYTSIIIGFFFMIINLLRHYCPSEKNFFGIPYEFSFPTPEKIKSKLWNQNKILFQPKIFGLGWTLNLQNILSWLILTLTIILILILFCLK